MSGQEELFRLGSVGAYPTPDAYLTPFFSTGVADNVTGFSLPAVDDLLKAARAEPDETKRFNGYQQAERMILEQLPVLPIAQFETQSISAPRAHGLVVSAMGTFDGTRVWLVGSAPR